MVRGKMNTKKYSKKQSEATQYGIEIYKALKSRRHIEGLTSSREINAFRYQYLAAKTELNDLPESVFNELLTKGIKLVAKIKTMERIRNKAACWCYCFRRFCVEMKNEQS